MRYGTVNYHLRKPERQAFVIDADGIAGKLISPELAVTQVALTDLRGTGAEAHFDRDGFAFAKAPSRIADFAQGADWRAQYDRELIDLLRDKTGAAEAVIFDHTLRVDDPEAERRPARNVHGDYSPDGAAARLIDILGAERAAEWSRGRFAFINVWRPVGAPINSAPLGFVRPATVAQEDWLEIDLIYPDRRGSIMGLAANDGHEWVYLSKMTPEEVVLFNIHDNSGRPSVAHSAVDLIEDPAVASIRKSVESRTLVRF